MKNNLLKIFGIILLAVAVFIGVRLFLDTYSPKDLKSEQFGPSELSPIETFAPVNEDTETTYRIPDLSTEEESSVDFDALHAINPDIYAWIEIPGTDISYPVVQHPSDDSFYLRTNSDGEYSAGGAIFSEATYNTKGFDDPVTILYGHHMNAGNIMFGHLQDYYSDSEFCEQDNPIRIYTADGINEYHVFAAVPYSREHILYYNDMSDPDTFTTFIESILSVREIGAYINEDYAPSDPSSDRVLILSTCLAGNNTRRFLVLATLSQDQ